MATVYLKNEQDVQVPLEQLEDFIYENKDKIETRRKPRRRQRQGDIPSNDAAATTSNR